MSAEMDPKLKRFFDSVPSYHKMWRDWCKDMRSYNSIDRIMPTSIEELTVLAHEYGMSVTGDIGIGKGRLKLRPVVDGQVINYLGDPIDDLGVDGVGISNYAAYKLKKEIFGEQPVNEDDIREEYARAAEKHSGPALGLVGGATFGDFVEQYERFEIRLYCSEMDGDESEWEDLSYGSKVVVADFELYFELERYLRRKGFLEPSQMLNPKAYFFPQTGRLMVELMGDNEYWRAFLLLGREIDEPGEILGFAVKEGVVG